jgi:hypothetical protein
MINQHEEGIRANGGTPNSELYVYIGGGYEDDMSAVSHEEKMEDAQSDVVQEPENTEMLEPELQPAYHGEDIRRYFAVPTSTE